MSSRFQPVHQVVTIVFFAVLITGCGKKGDSEPRFKLLRKETTGLDFQNNLKATVAFNPLNYMYFYNGGGIAAGDFNQDGKVDLYFTSNMGENKLFLNQGGMKFKDVTEQAGVSGLMETGAATKWSTGASVVDINNDGMLDIYVSQVGSYLSLKGHNHLFVCKEIKDGIPRFEDEAIVYGLDLVGFGTQAAFFDYDGDGDLDMYQLNHSVHANGTFGQKKTFEGTQHPLSGDKLMRNDGDKFTDVTLLAGIKSTVIGYGLGIATGDVNLDGWPDIYIGNDFHENDYLYINQQDGTFKECLTEQMMHTSQFSMGVDIADMNNDGWSDIFTLDMQPEDPFILKSSLGEDDYGVYNFKLSYGYNYQYARNNLQLNNGSHFSEIGMFAGVDATDWSWAALFADFDNDGYKDLFISNGIVRRMNDIDYANFRLGNEDIRFKTSANRLEDGDLQVVEKMPKIKLPNKFYHNTGQRRFEDMENQISGALPTFSNGAVYADLDNDGDLDMVVNNLEDEPYVYQNLEDTRKSPDHAYLSFDLKGAPANRNAIGARIIAFKKEEKLVFEHFPVRGYESSALIPLHCGIGKTESLDSVIVIWPDRTFQRIEDLQINTRQALSWKPGLPVFDFSHFKQKASNPFDFKDLTQASGLTYMHHEDEFVEFNREFLIPHMVSTEGPALAVGDVNGDGLEDVFFGASKFEKCALYLQNKQGAFILKTPDAMLADSVFEDVDAVLVDIENDGDLDLAIAEGGNEWRGENEGMKQRYFLNDGKGNFERHDFPGAFATASCVLPCDFDKDGLVDFFIGGRALPWNYGLTPKSFLFQNKGNGNFEDVAGKIGGGLDQAGLVKNGAWADMDADGDQDLVLALEWGPVTIFKNNQNSFEKSPINDLTGWWNFTLPYDFDGDGDLDILAGNLGQNAKFRPTQKEPVRMFVHDFDNNGQIEQIITYFTKGREIPFANHSEIMKALPSLKKKYLYAKEFAKASIPELLGKENLAKSIKREVNTFASSYFENIGGGKFTPHSLPDELQYSTLNACWLADLDHDGRQEVLLGGNFYENNIELGRYDANCGNVLSISKENKISVYPLGNLCVNGQVRRIRPLKIGSETAYVFARNNERCVVLGSIK